MALNPGTEAPSGDGETANDLTHRQCLINITNGFNNCTLGNPKWYTYSGICASPLPPTIPDEESGSALFVKSPHTACGAVGVVTCDLLFDGGCQTCGKIAIMFSNPYDMNLYSNLFAVGIFDQSKECDYELYKEMYYETGESFVRSKAGEGVLEYNSQRVEIKATMSDAYQSEIKLEVSEVKRR